MLSPARTSLFEHRSSSGYPSCSAEIRLTYVLGTPKRRGFRDFDISEVKLSILLKGIITPAFAEKEMCKVAAGAWWIIPEKLHSRIQSFWDTVEREFVRRDIPRIRKSYPRHTVSSIRSENLTKPKIVLPEAHLDECDLMTAGRLSSERIYIHFPEMNSHEFHAWANRKL